MPERSKPKAPISGLATVSVAGAACSCAVAGTAASISAPSAAVAIRREEIFKRVMIFPGYRFEARIRAVETHRGSAMQQLYARFSGAFNRRPCRSSLPHVEIGRAHV